MLVTTLAIADPASPSAGNPACPNTNSQLPSRLTPSATAAIAVAHPGRPSAAAVTRITPAIAAGIIANNRISRNAPARAATTGS